MEYFDNILCVTYKELLDIMPKGTLNSQLSRENWMSFPVAVVKIIRLCMPIPPFPRNTRNVGLSVMANPRNK